MCVKFCLNFFYIPKAPLRLRVNPPDMPGTALFLYFCHDGLESLGIVHGELGEHLAVDLDAGCMDETHELGVGKILHACGGVDTLDPEGAEVALFLLAVAVCIGKTLLPGVLRYGPHVAAAAVVTTGEFKYFFALCA